MYLAKYDVENWLTLKSIPPPHHPPQISEILRQSPIKLKMAVSCTVNLILQILSIALGVYGIIAGIVMMTNGSFRSIIMGVFVIIFGVALILVEVYIFGFFSYFGFLMKQWGKAIMYLFLGALLWGTSGMGLANVIIFWAAAIAYFIFAFVIPIVNAPILQGGMNSGSPPDLTVNSTSIYEASGNDNV